MRSGERGFALILTLWILAILSVLLSSLTMLAALDNRSTLYALRVEQASFLGRGALRRVAAELAPREDLGSNEKLAQIRAEKTGRWVVDSRDWSVRQLREDERPPEAAEQILCEVSVEDARLPMSRLGKEMLAKLPRVTPVLADSIVATLGLDAPAQGAQSSASVNTGAVAKSGDVAKAGADAAVPPQGMKEQPLARLLPVEALLRVEAVRGEVYDGTPDAPGLKDLLTRFSDGRIFVNRATKAVLQVVPGVDEATAAEIQARLAKGQMFERVEDLQNVPGVTPAIYKSLQGWVKVVPSYYRIVAREPQAATAVSAVVAVSPVLRLVYQQGG